MRPHLKLFTAFLVDMRRAQYRETLDRSGQRDRTAYLRASPLGRADDFIRRLVKNTVIKCFQPDPDILVFHVQILWRKFKTGNDAAGPLGFSGYLTIEATTPAPTVRPPSRIAKRRPSSMAIGAISSTVMAMLSPGITISVPAGSSTEPVTSVVRK